MDRVIQFSNVSLVIGGRHILDGINIDIARGEFVAIVGPSGCGKTTLLRLLAGLALPSSGEILLDGTPVRAPRQDVAVVFQDYGKALLPWRKASGNIALALEAMNVPRDQWPARIAELLATMGLDRDGDKRPGEMSGGMQQRLQIARCLAQQPSVLLMDEPFGALDAITRQVLQDEVLALAERTGMTVFFVTHDLEEAIYLGDRVVALSANPGRVARTFPIDLPHPRDQLSTREHPIFLELRHDLFSFIKGGGGR
jgi:NitT/TauT family transport system ATP-binding protein